MLHCSREKEKVSEAGSEIPAMQRFDVKISWRRRKSENLWHIYQSMDLIMVKTVLPCLRLQHGIIILQRETVNFCMKCCRVS